MIEVFDTARWLGLSADTVVEARLLAAAGTAILIAWGLGYALARFVAPRVQNRMGSRFTFIPGGIGLRAGHSIGATFALIVLAAAGDVAAPDPFGILTLAVATGLTAAYLVFQLCRTAQVGIPLASLLVVATLVAVVAAKLGGLRPLLDVLDGIKLDVGKYSLSLLGALNGLLVVGSLFALTRFLMRVSTHWIDGAQHLDGSQRVLFQKLSGLSIVAAAIFVGIDLLGIDLTALAVFSGALGLAVGFGMQKTFGNLLAGLILLMDRSIKPGDVIVIGDTFGWVNKIGVRAVSVLTRDGKEFLIPNEKLMTEQVENWSYSSRNVRIHIAVGVSYKADIRKAQELMLQAAKETPRVLADPPPNVWLTGYGDSSVDHDILIWIADAEEGTGNVRSAILNRLWDLFKAEGIEIPYPQRDVHLHTTAPESDKAATPSRRRKPPPFHP